MNLYRQPYCDAAADPLGLSEVTARRSPVVAALRCQAAPINLDVGVSASNSSAAQAGDIKNTIGTGDFFVGGGSKGAVVPQWVWYVVIGLAALWVIGRFRK